MSTHENPLLDLGYDIPFDRIRAEHVEPAIEALIERVRAQLTEIGDATDTPTYAGTLEALEAATARSAWWGTSRAWPPPRRCARRTTRSARG